MITDEHARTLAQASLASYGTDPIPTGYELVQQNGWIEDPNTGFRVLNGDGVRSCKTTFPVPRLS